MNLKKYIFWFAASRWRCCEGLSQCHLSGAPRTRRTRALQRCHQRAPPSNAKPFLFRRARRPASSHSRQPPPSLPHFVKFKPIRSRKHFCLSFHARPSCADNDSFSCCTDLRSRKGGMSKSGVWQETAGHVGPAEVWRLGTGCVSFDSLVVSL